MNRRFAIVVFAVTGLLTAGNSAGPQGGGEISAKARKLHFNAVVVDAHVDVTQRMVWEAGFDFAKRHTDGHTDLPRMREGGLDAIFFSVWMQGSVTGPAAVKGALRQIDAVRQTVAANSKDMMLATTAAEVRRAKKEGKIAALIGIEGGHMMDDDLRVLRMYADLGVRYLTLTHSKNTKWADSSGDKAAHNGLTDFGKNVVEELNRQGVMVDISHVADKTFWDALEVSRAPMIASHSSARAISNHPRNMTDEMIKALAAKGGVVMVNYYNAFLDQGYRDASRALGESNDDFAKQMAAKCGKNDACVVRESERLDKEMMAQGKLPKVSWEKIVEHMDHVARIAGAEHVGLGSDFDGATLPEGMEDVTKMPKITEALLKKGYSEKQVRGILGENVLRVMEQVERVSAEMRAGSQNAGPQQTTAQQGAQSGEEAAQPVRERTVVPRENVVVSEKARRVHFGSIVLDTHVDVTARLMGTEGFNIAKRHDTGHVDIPRMKEGGLNALFFSIYMSGRTTGPVAVKRSLGMIDAVKQAVAANSKDMMLATTAAEVRRARREGKIAALMGMEGGHMIDDDLGVLRMYAALGVRYLTLTHSVNVNWADSSGEAAKSNGLTDFGKKVVEELNRQGVMVDISHVADKTFWDALAVSRAPMIASHSSLRSIGGHARDMTDEMVAGLAKKGGVIQITFVTSFISNEVRLAEEAIRDERTKRLAEADKIQDATERRGARQKIQEEYRAKLPKVSWEKIVEHIDKAVKIAGIDHVGLGSDFDGATMPEGMEDCTRLPKITDALLKRGYSEKDVKKILGGNLLRVMEEVERVRRQMLAAR